MDLPTLILFSAVGLLFVLMQLNQRVANPGLAVINRWVRWLVFAGGTAWLLVQSGSVDRPFWVMAAACFLVWFLLETIYNWLAIKALSLSPLPLFPRYDLNPAGDEWPTNPRLLKVRDWLRTNGFKQVQALKSEIAPGLYLRVSIYHDADAKVRVQVTFLPQNQTGAIALCLSFTSNTSGGGRFVTDNLFLPFGGFYPENWIVERHPWMRSPERLLKWHLRRLAQSGEIVTPWVTEPLQDLNSQQRELDQINTELGFLMPPAQREEYGKISHEGRFRVWKEYWLLNYFGRSSRYE